MALPLPHIKMSCVSLHTKFSLFNLIYSPAIHSLVHCWMCWARQWSMPLSVLLQKFFQRLALTWRSERMQTCAIFFAHFIALHAAKHLSVHTRRPWGSMGPRKLRLLQGSTSMDIIGLKHKSTNQIKRLTHSPCDERWMQKLTLCTGASGRHRQSEGTFGVWTHMSLVQSNQTDYGENLQRTLWSPLNTKKKKKLQGEAGLQFGPEGSLVRRKKWRGWPLVVLTASISYLKAKRRLAVRLIRESVGNVSGHYAKCTAAGIQRFLTFV